jgi:hypothetical protein
MYLLAKVFRSNLFFLAVLFGGASILHAGVVPPSGGDTGSVGPRPYTECDKYMAIMGTLENSQYAFITLFSNPATFNNFDGCISNINANAFDLSTKSYRITLSSLGDQYPGLYPTVAPFNQLNHDFRLVTRDSTITLENLIRYGISQESHGISNMTAQQAHLYLSAEMAAGSIQDALQKVWTYEMMRTIGIPSATQNYVQSGRDPVHSTHPNSSLPMVVTIREDVAQQGALLNWTENTLVLSTKSRLNVDPTSPISSFAYDREGPGGEFGSKIAATIAQAPNASTGTIPPESTFMLTAGQTISAALIGDAMQDITSCMLIDCVNHTSGNDPNGSEVLSNFYTNARIADNIPCSPPGVSISGLTSCTRARAMNNGHYYNPANLSGITWPNVICSNIQNPPMINASLAATFFNSIFYRLAKDIGTTRAFYTVAKAVSKIQDQNHITMELFAQHLWTSANELYGTQAIGPQVQRALSIVLLQKGVSYISGQTALQLQNSVEGPAIGMTVRGFTIASSHAALPPSNPCDKSYNAYHDTVVMPANATYAVLQMNAFSELNAGNSFLAGPFDGTYQSGNIPTGYTVTTRLETDPNGKIPVLANRFILVPVDPNTHKIAFSHYRARAANDDQYANSLPVYGFQVKTITTNGYGFDPVVVNTNPTNTTFRFDIVDPSDASGNDYTYAWTFTRLDGTQNILSGKNVMPPAFNNDQFVTVSVRRTKVSNGAITDISMSDGVANLRDGGALVQGSATVGNVGDGFGALRLEGGNSSKPGDDKMSDACFNLCTP